MKVMFVYDANEVLDGLRRAFRHYRDSWEMSFYQNPREALADLQ